MERTLLTVYRYTDFMVNEITPGGIVVHLTDDSIPKAKYKDAPIDAVGEVSNAVELEDNSGHHVVATTVSLVLRAFSLGSSTRLVLYLTFYLIG